MAAVLQFLTLFLEHLAPANMLTRHGDETQILSGASIVAEVLIEIVSTTELSLIHI